MTSAISIRQVTKTYGGLKALDGLSLEIEQGEFFGLLGPNGAGKTTLISALAGLVRPDSGTLEVMGHSVTAEYRAARRQLGVVPQELVFDPFFSVRELLRFQSGYFGIRGNDDWIDELLHSLDLTHKADSGMRQLSGGMKRRVLVAQALVHRPPVIVLDEPTAGVDVALRKSLWQFIEKLNRQGHTIVLTTHYLEEAETLCQRIGMMRSGSLVALEKTSDLLKRFSSLALRFRLKDGAAPDASLGAHWLEDDGLWALPLAHVSEVEALLARLRLSGGLVEDLFISQPDLETVFVQLMQETPA